MTRTKLNINLNQCDKCGKIVKDGNLSSMNFGNYEGLALCSECEKTEKEK